VRTFRPIFKLVAIDFGDGEITRLGVGQVEAGDRGGRYRGKSCISGLIDKDGEELLINTCHVQP
jgi:hypothetical protein